MIGLLPICFVIDPWVCFFFAKCFYILWMLVIFSYNVFFNKSNTFFSGNSEQYKFYESQNNSPHCGKQSNAGKMYESYAYHFTSYAISNFITWKYICPKSKVLKSHIQCSNVKVKPVIENVLLQTHMYMYLSWKSFLGEDLNKIKDIEK